ncbi:MAG: succinylglutamate desuccinylase/aspartoacylase family protein [Acidimicrobiales bacterium]|nr:succinylglutamate desuccinylase/aspartoacylase family protein [Acidimicrobiales bacterium]
MATIEVHQFRSLEPGPRLIVTGAVHGNEVCGTVAIREVVKEFSTARRRLDRGMVTFVPVCNPVAYAAGRREGDGNLNRNFAPTEHPATVEERIANHLAPLLAEHDVLVDLHSFRTPGKPFVFVGPEDNDGDLEPFTHAATEAALALAVGPDRFVYGWLPTYATGAVKREGGRVEYGIGTTEYMRSVGGAAITVECGQHEDPEAPSRARRAIDNALAVLGLEADGPADLPDPARSVELIELHEVHDRLHPDDRFSGQWRSFDRIAAGQAIAERADGTVLAPEEESYVVFPNPDTRVGSEWFYLGRPGTRDFRGIARQR